MSELGASVKPGSAGVCDIVSISRDTGNRLWVSEASDGVWVQFGSE